MPVTYQISDVFGIERRFIYSRNIGGVEFSPDLNHVFIVKYTLKMS